MKYIKAIFFDIDGTIYDAAEKRIPDSAIDALHGLQAKGIRIFLATGRSIASIHETTLQSRVTWDGYVCSNGAVLHDKDERILDARVFSKFQMDQLLKLAERDLLKLVVQTTDQVFAPLGISNDMKDAYAFFHLPLPPVRSYAQEDITMALVYPEPDYDYSRIQRVEGLIAVKGRTNYADVVQIGLTKSFGIRNILRLLNMQNAHWMAFGDGDNDIEMIEDADIGIAMGNASDALKKSADYVTFDIRNDGIRNALKHYRLI